MIPDMRLVLNRGSPAFSHGGQPSIVSRILDVLVLSQHKGSMFFSLTLLSYAATPLSEYHTSPALFDTSR